MTEKITVVVTVKRTDDFFVQLGLNKETDDFNIILEVCKRLNDLSIKTYIKDVDTHCSEKDKKVLREARLLIVVATKESYLNAAQSIIELFEKEEEKSTKKIVYLCAETVGEMRSDSFSNYAINGHFLTETFELSQRNSISLFVKNIYTYLNTSKEDRKSVTVKNILKSSCSISRTIEKATKRKWLDNILDNWLKRSDRRHIFWLCGEHGSGKTIFIGDYCARLNNVLGKGIYYCHYSSRETQNIERIIKAIAYELSVSVTGYAEVIYNLVIDEQFHNKSAEELLPSLLVNPFNEHPEIYPTNGNLVIAIDGIDELKTDKTDALTSFLELFRNYAQSLPDFIRFIITSPAIDDISNTMKQLSVKIVDLAEIKYQVNKKADAERFLCSELDDLEIEYTDDDIQKVLEKSEWNFDYLHYFIDQWDDGNSKKLPPLNDLPQGLTAMFEVDFSNSFSDDFYNNRVKPILQILAATYEPFSVVDLSQILSLNVNEVQSIIKGQLRQFLKFPNEFNHTEVVSLYNMSFGLWLVQKNHKYCIDIESGTKAIVEWFKKKKGHFYKNEYLQKYGLLHVLEYREYEIIEKLIIESEADDFEKLKEKLSRLFVSDCKNQVNAMSELINIYRINYEKNERFRDILVYTYRYILKREGEHAAGLIEIFTLLSEKNEKIRAYLLMGEGISEYEEAKKHFKYTIEQAQIIIQNSNGNIWWDKRMLGVAYNRLGNLENKAGNIDEAVLQYENGKACFDEAIEILSADIKQLNDFKADYKILQRDEAIINERLGDLSFKKRDFSSAVRYYTSYYNACFSTYNNASTLNSKWDLSISLLRLGDAERYLGQLQEAQEKYKTALDLRRDILQHMRGDCISIISNGNQSYYMHFSCPKNKLLSEVIVDEVPKESRDIDPIRDIALCYVRLGDLAFSLGLYEIAGYYYDILVKLCEKNNAEVKTSATENDLTISRRRKDRICKYVL